MRRSAFVKLLGITEEAFNLLRARKLVPLRGSKKGRGWQEFSVDDAIAFEAAAALSRQGVKKADACAIVDYYFDIAIERFVDDGEARPFFLGIMKPAQAAPGRSTLDLAFGLIGTTSHLAEDIERYVDAVGDIQWLDGFVAIDLRRCVATVLDRAEEAGLADPALQAKAAFFKLL